MMAVNPVIVAAHESSQVVSVRTVCTGMQSRSPVPRMKTEHCGHDWALHDSDCSRGVTKRNKRITYFTLFPAKQRSWLYNTTRREEYNNGNIFNSIPFARQQEQEQQ
jgi:hypothetical protein